MLVAETFARFPGCDGWIVRTGETYTYDTPYHVGNSPKHNPHADPWVDFISFLRDEVCSWATECVGAEPAFYPRKHNELVLSIGMGFADTVPFRTRPTHPVLTRPISNPQNPLFCPRNSGVQVCIGHRKDLFFRSWDNWPAQPKPHSH